MSDAGQYALLDFGQGRKLERFGACRIDRPAPAAGGRRTRPEAWPDPDARFNAAATGRRGTWESRLEAGHEWEIRLAELRFRLHLTDYGQVGIYPEQAANWQWLQSVIGGRVQPPKVLNLFAYTGAASLVAARAGADVTHVDAARTAVKWARHNAALSGLEQAPIRWIVDDVTTYVGRELKREQCYQGIILDPPSFGRGPRGQTWSFQHDLPPLLKNCFQLMPPDDAFLLLTCHTSGVTPDALQKLVHRLSPHGAGKAGPLELVAADGRRLPCGAYVRWPA
jgi:23S rRNA (cytosine1962-C5)-methyltransferase